MINSQEFTDYLAKIGLNYFTGVPDSLMANLCWELVRKAETSEGKINTEIVANEGVAVANCIGYYLATGKPGVVFLQNAGLGNIYNPFASLCSSGVFNIPIIFLIGWRGGPGVKDEPQHVLQGKITAKTLKILEIPLFEVNALCDLKFLVNSKFLQRALEKKKSCALLFEQGSI